MVRASCTVQVPVQYGVTGNGIESDDPYQNGGPSRYQPLPAVVWVVTLTKVASNNQYIFQLYVHIVDGMSSHLLNHPTKIVSGEIETALNH